MESEIDSQTFHEIIEAERKWEESQKLSDTELVKVFSELKNDIIPTKIKELIEEKEHLQEQIKKTLWYLRIRFPKDHWFLRILTKHTLIKDLIEIEKQVSYFERLKFLFRTRKNDRVITDGEITQALAYPIQNVLSQEIRLRRSGRNLIALCLLHKERTPSFYIYTDTNSFYCFGCNRGGNVITLVRLLHNLSFQEAIKLLTL